MYVGEKALYVNHFQLNIETKKHRLLLLTLTGQNFQLEVRGINISQKLLRRNPRTPHLVMQGNYKSLRVF
jgi:hypothetical protein